MKDVNCANENHYMNHQITAIHSPASQQQHLSYRKETSPIFTSMLDALYQIMLQYPKAFEFSEHLLIYLHRQLHSCEFGTFLTNCESERSQLNNKHKTRSIWQYLMSSRRPKRFINASYAPPVQSQLSSASTSDSSCLESPIILRPDLSARNLTFWAALYAPSMHIFSESAER